MVYLLELFVAALRCLWWLTTLLTYIVWVNFDGHNCLRHLSVSECKYSSLYIWNRLETGITCSFNQLAFFVAVRQGLYIKKENCHSSNTNEETHTHLFNGPFPGLPRWAGNRKVKQVWILLKQDTVTGSGISWAICKSAPRSRQITMPAPHHSSFL